MSCKRDGFQRRSQAEGRRAKRVCTEPESGAAGGGRLVATVRPIHRWAHPSPFVVAQLPNEQFPKIHAPFSSPEPFESDSFPGKGLGNEPHLSTPADFAVGLDLPRLPSSWILQRLATLRELSAAGAIQLGWHLHLQRFVRPVLVILLDPALGSSSLPTPSVRRRIGRLSLHHAMKLLVPGVVFGVASPAKLHRNVLLDPPRAQTRQPQRPLRTERAAIVHSNPSRQPALAKQASEDRQGGGDGLLPHQVDGQRVSAESISHRQRFDARPIAQSEPSLKVRRPHVIGRSDGPPRDSAHLGAIWPPDPTPADHSPMPQPTPQGRGGGDTDPTVAKLEAVAQLARAPGPMPSPHLPGSASPFSPDGLRMLLSHWWPVLQTAPAVSAVTLEPLVSRFSTDVPLPTQLGHRGAWSPCLLDKVIPLMKFRFFVPGHNGPGSVTHALSLKCYPSCESVPSVEP